MAWTTKPRRCLFFQKGPSFQLLFLWILGLVCGVWFAFSAGESYFSLMRSAPTARTSIISLWGILFLPFMISAFAVLMDTPVLFFSVSFAKSFFLAFTSVGALLAFPTGGWLVRLLLMFSQICISPVLLLFMLQCLSGNKQSLPGTCAAAGGYAILVASIDHCYIAPFLSELMKN